MTVYDDRGNSESTSFRVTILPVDHDNDDDGIPDLVEKANGLDMNSSSDASLDPDNAGLTNLDEYLHGTDMNDEDTDNDEMPDDWEILHGLDPLALSADNDADGDGKTDLEEFIDGTNPNVKEDEENNYLTLLFGLILVMILLITGLSVGLYLYMKGRNKIEGEE